MSKNTRTKAGADKAEAEREQALKANLSPADQRAEAQRKEQAEEQRLTPDKDGRVVDATRPADGTEAVQTPVRHDPNQVIASEQAPVEGALDQVKDEPAIYKGEHVTITRKAGQGDAGFDLAKGLQVVIRRLDGAELVVLKSETSARS